MYYFVLPDIGRYVKNTKKGQCDRNRPFSISITPIAKPFFICGLLEFFYKVSGFDSVHSIPVSLDRINFDFVFTLNCNVQLVGGIQKRQLQYKCEEVNFK